MTIAVFGAGGQLGRALLRVGSRLGLDIAGFDRQAADITDAIAIGTVLAKVQAHLIINAAAYTAVDKAESNVERAFAINRDGVANLARTGLPLIHISTDYVFDGRKRGAYVETDPVAPLGGPARALKPSPRATIPRRPRAPPIQCWTAARQKLFSALNCHTGRVD